MVSAHHSVRPFGLEAKKELTPSQPASYTGGMREAMAAAAKSCSEWRNIWLPFFLPSNWGSYYSQHLLQLYSTVSKPTKLLLPAYKGLSTQYWRGQWRWASGPLGGNSCACGIGFSITTIHPELPPPSNTPTPTQTLQLINSLPTCPGTPPPLTSLVSSWETRRLTIITFPAENCGELLTRAGNNTGLPLADGISRHIAHSEPETSARGGAGGHTVGGAKFYSVRMCACGVFTVACAQKDVLTSDDAYEREGGILAEGSGRIV